MAERPVSRPAPKRVSAAAHNRVLEAAQRRVDRLEGRLAGIVQEILDRAGTDAARAFEARATNHLTAAAADVGVTSTSAMVCVRPRPDEAATIADPDGDPPDRLHVTLVYLGDVDGDLSAVADALRPVAASLAPLEGVVGGYGVFEPPGVGILLPDVRGLVELRVAVCEALLAARVDYARNHGFEAHVTVTGDPSRWAGNAAAQGAEEGGTYPASACGLPLHFDALHLVRGDVDEVVVPLVGAPALTASSVRPSAAGAEAGHDPLYAPPQWTAPFPDEILDVDALVAEILAKTEPVRLAMIEKTMTPALEQAGLSWDVTNPLAGEVLARSADQVTRIAATTQLNVMRIVKAAFANGLTIPQTASAIREGMREASKTRATMIARTELCRAASGGSLAATRIVARATDTTYVKTWLTAPGAKFPRHEDYDGLDGQTVGLEEEFQVGEDQLLYPGDPSGDPSETINCLPGSMRIVASEASVGFRRRYVGSLVRIEASGGHVLSGTPNHPVLTRTGWKPLNLVREGDYLVCGRLREVAAVAGPDVDHAPAAIQQVVAALARGGESRRVRGRAVKFHGDLSADGEVEVVTANRELREYGDAALFDPAAEDRLVRADEVLGSLASSGATREVVLAAATTADRVVRRSGESLPRLGGGLSHPLPHGGGTAARFGAGLHQTEADRGAADAVAFGQGLLGDAFEVSLAKVFEVKVDAFHGEVFNLQTRSGAYLAEGIITHNCRCAMKYATPEGEDESEAEDAPDLGDASSLGFS